MPATYEPIATTTLSSAASSITFSSIPSTYTDLRVVLNVSGSGIAVLLTLNNDTASNYSYTALAGTGSAASSYRGTSQSSIDPRYNAISTWNFFTADIFSYAGSTFKTLLTTGSQDANGSGSVNSQVQLWRSTSAINRLDIGTGGTGNMAIGTTATLYGIKAA